MKPRRINRHQQGSFSLIEAMVAIAVLGIGIAGALYSLSGSLECAKRVQQRLTAYDLLRLKIAEFAQVRNRMDAQKGKFDPPFEQFEWQVEIVPTELAGLFLVKVDISWPGRKIRRHIQTQTLAPQS